MGIHYIHPGFLEITATAPLTPSGGLFAPANGAIAMLAAALIVLVVRLRLFAPVWRRRTT